MSAAPARPKPLDLRKYPNRRYYDATHSRHLTLEEIRELVRKGHDITVTDSKSGADITAQVLTQIILELETPKIDSFPVALLLRMIRSNDQVVREFIETYFNQAFKAYSEYQKQMEQQLRQFHGASGLFPPFGAWMQPPFGSFGAGLTGQEPGPKVAEPASSGEAENLRHTVSELQQQLAALQAAVGRRRPRRRAKAKRRARKA